MERRRSCLKPAILAVFLAAAGTSGAFALEADQVGERLKELMARQQIELSYDAAHLAGSDVTLENVTAKSADAEGSISLGDLTLEDVTEEEDGSFRVGTLAVDEFEHQADDINIAMVDFTMSGLVLPKDRESDPFGGEMRYDRLTVARVDVSGEDGPIGSLSDMHADLFVSDEDGALEGTGGVESFSLDLAGLMDDNAKAQSTLADFGYGQISGSAFVEGRWRPSDGRVTISRYEAVVEDAGTLNLMLDFSGYTPQFARTLEETARAMEQQSDQNQSMQGMAMLGLMQQLTFHGATIRFTDDSLTGKVLEHTAEEQSTSPDQVIAQVKAFLPAQLSPFIGAELAGTLAQEVGAFLEEPGNIEISAQPESPLPFASLMAAAMGSPEMLVRQIGLSVKANQ